jgi:hypothetical protein
MLNLVRNVPEAAVFGSTHVLKMSRFPLAEALNPRRPEGENQMADEQRNREEKGAPARKSEEKHRQGEKGGQQRDEKSRTDQNEQERGGQRSGGRQGRGN